MDSNRDTDSTGEPGRWTVWDDASLCTTAERTPIADQLDR